jgi:hypothetical protein
MLTTSVFTAPFEFVVWTVSSSLYQDACRTVSTPFLYNYKTWLGITNFKASPNLTGYTYQSPSKQPLNLLAYPEYITVMLGQSNCKVCGKYLKGRQTLFCSIACKNITHQSYAAQKKRGLERKLYFIETLGGKCSRCGYASNLAALAFHHVGGKEFQLDVRALSNRKIDPILKEIAKCKLLCNNCHAEVHHPSLDLAKLLT